MQDARRFNSQFEVTRTWKLPDVPVQTGDEDLEHYLRRIGFTDEQIRYTQRSYVNAAGDAIRYLSAEAYLEDMRDESCGSGDFRIMDGYDRLIQHLASSLEIHLNTPVNRLEWSADGVRAITPSGTFEAEQVIITASLGVLQAGLIEFVPALPPEKLHAIQALRMGPGIKLILKLNDHPVPRSIMAIYSDKNPPMWWSPSFGHDSDDIIWTALATGDHARWLLEKGEQGALNAALETLRLECDRPDLQVLDAHLVNWPADPYIQGGYSVTPPGQQSQRAALAQPVSDVLFWAGEATMSSVYTATVHGAHASGERAAIEVLNRMQASS
jgi:monoamine oxidase